MLVTEPAVSVNCTGALPVARRAGAGLSFAVQAQRRQFGAVPSALPFGANAVFGSSAPHPLGMVPVRGLLNVGLPGPSSRLRSTIAWIVRDTLLALIVAVTRTRHWVWDATSVTGGLARSVVSPSRIVMVRPETAPSPSWLRSVITSAMVGGVAPQFAAPLA